MRAMSGVIGGRRAQGLQEEEDAGSQEEGGMWAKLPKPTHMGEALQFI